MQSCSKYVSRYFFSSENNFIINPIIKRSSLIGCLTVIALRGPLRLVLKINLFGSALQVSVEGNVAATYNYGLLLRHPILLLSFSFFSFVSGCFSSPEVYLFCDFDASKIVPAER